MKSFTQYLTEAGAASGTHELIKTTLDQARVYAELAMTRNNRTLYQEIPDFDENYQHAQSEAIHGRTARKDMPVIDAKDVKDFQRRLAQGFIDVKAPFSSEELKSNPFPKGLAGGFAKQWLEAGLPVHDENKHDDKINVKQMKVPVKSLKPIQQQIYFDKSINQIAKGGSKATKAFISGKSTFIVSNDDFIIDGHHRWLSGLLVDANIKVNILKIDMPLIDLLPLALSYSDAVGNKRNA